jgi:DNA-binding LacI/PurR family transcriptional regulator
MMTVSNVINGTGKVSDQTRARVRQAIRNTGYVPNYEARRFYIGSFLSVKKKPIHIDSTRLEALPPVTQVIPVVSLNCEGAMIVNRPNL